MVNLVGPLDAEKEAEAGFLNAFTIGFLAHPFLEGRLMPWVKGRESRQQPCFV